MKTGCDIYISSRQYLINALVASLMQIVREQKNTTIIYLGCSQADLILSVIGEFSENKHVLVDDSIEMVRNQLSAVSCSGGIFFEERDALSYLKEMAVREVSGSSIIVSSWMIHSFESSHRNELLSAIADSLTPGQFFVWLDAIYPNVSEKEMKEILFRKKSQYAYLSIPLHRKICVYEDWIFSIRMEESPTLNLLRSLGFDSEIEARVAQDALIVAKRI